MSTAQSPGGPKPKVALIAGPTATGKSDLAVRLALRRAERGLPSVVINADSAQVYADLQILSARPTEAEMHGVPHRLFGAWDASEACSAADWAAAARCEVARAQADCALPILVGGTGLYIRTLLDGIAPIPPIDPAVRAEVRAIPVAEAHAALAREDPAGAQRLSPGDTTRVARALEVVRSTGHPLSHWQERREGGIRDGVTLHPLILEAEREWLAERCDRRFAIMVESRGADEVSALLARDLDPALPVMRAIGVREIAAWLRGETTREQAVAAGQLATRQYAKRQATWFRNQPPADWPRARAEDFSKSARGEILFSDELLT